MLYSLDIETKSITNDKDDALTPHLSVITVVGLVAQNGTKRVFRDLNSLKEFITPDMSFIAHNGKFDFKHLYRKGINLIDQWVGDTNLMAISDPTKVPEKWLEDYEAKRQLLDKSVHREVGPHSLKGLAPYHLNVEPFWEAANHDNDEYVLKDAEYTLRLYNHYLRSLPPGSAKFYNEKLMPWAKMLLKAEIIGIKLDKNLLDIYTKEYDDTTKRLVAELKEVWAEAFRTYAEIERDSLRTKYKGMEAKQLAKVTAPTPEKTEKINNKYAALYEKALVTLDTELNLSSPKQLTWLLRDHLNLDIKDFNNEESTGKEVLERLAAEGREDVKLFLEYRKANKIHTAFLPKYKSQMRSDDTLSTTFNIGGARTGRLSSSGSYNGQQVSKVLHPLFIARDGFQLATYDAAQIEPRIILHYTDDPRLFEIFSEGLDLYGTFAIDLFDLNCHPSDVKTLFPKERAVGKTFALASFYGAGWKRLQVIGMTLGMRFDEWKCKEMYWNFKEQYEPIFKWKENLDKSLKQGNSVTNLLGRPYKIENPQDVHMKGFNTLIQGSASDLIINSAKRIQDECDRRNEGGNVLLLVHDEIVTEIPENAIDIYSEIIETSMTDYKLDNVKLKVEGKVAKSWTK